MEQDEQIGGKGRGGFEPLPSAEPPALIAARKSRDQKNKIIIKIGAVVVLVTAAVATLAAFLITRGEHSQSLPSAPPPLPISSRIMSDKITAVNQVAAVATGNTVFGSRLYQQLKDEPGNIIMSPFSVSGVMAMVAAGAGGELTKTLHLRRLTPYLLRVVLPSSMLTGRPCISISMLLFRRRTFISTMAPPRRCQ